MFLCLFRPGMILNGWPAYRKSGGDIIWPNSRGSSQRNFFLGLRGKAASVGGLSTITHGANRRLEIRPHVRAALAAPRARELPFNVGQPNVIRPLVGIDRHGVRALVITAIDADPAHAGRAHLRE